MKIIGKAGDLWLAEISGGEIAQTKDLDYEESKRYCYDLKVGEVVNLGAASSFRTQIIDACRQMVKTKDQFDQAAKALYAFAQAMVDKEAGEGKP